MMTAWTLLGGALTGVATGWWGNQLLMTLATHAALITKNLLELVSLPVIFLSIVSSLAGMENGQDARILGGRVLRYTLLTTALAALIGLILFTLINPVGDMALLGSGASPALDTTSYGSFFLSMIPSNLVHVFSGQAGVMAVVFVGLLFGSAILTLQGAERAILRDGFTALFSLMIAITRFILRIMPFGVWAFTALFVHGMHDEASKLTQIGWYIVVVLLANIIQGTVILPLFVWLKGLSPHRLFTAFRPALGFAFLSKSSNMTLPITLECARENAGISEKIARFSFPLCATINMNGCAAFILITILFVAGTSGIPLTLYDKLFWLLLATGAAVGNAGVPMGCFFLTTAFLIHFGMPVELMGIILPVYSLLDMVETTLNVWSDACVTAVVNQECTQRTCK